MNILNRTLSSRFSAIVLLWFVTSFAEGEILFSDNFESGSISSSWSVSEGGEGRVQILDLTVAGKSSHWLVLDDKSSNSAYSTAAVTANLDLTGYDRVEISFDVYSPGDEDQDDGSWRDSFRVWVDGESVYDYSLFEAPRENPNSVGRAVIYLYVSAFPGRFDPRKAVSIKFGFAQYDNESWPSDGWAVDNLVIDGKLAEGTYLYHPSMVDEDGESFDLDIAISPPPTEGTNVAVYFADRLVGGGAYPGGAKGKVFPVTIVDNPTLNYSRPHLFRVEIPGEEDAIFSLVIMEDETPTFKFELPSEISEAYSAEVMGRVAVVPPAGEELQISVGDGGTGQLELVTGTLQPGQSVFEFPLRAIDDVAIESGEVAPVVVTLVEITASSSVKILDDDQYELRVGGSSSELYKEGTSVMIDVGSRSYALEDLVVKLTTDAPDSVGLPSQIIIPKGFNNSEPFEVLFIDNDKATGTQVYHVTATLVGVDVPSATASFIVADNEIAGFRVEYGPMLQLGAEPEFKIYAIGRNGEDEWNFEESATISLLLSDGSEEALFGGEIDFLYGSSYHSLPVTQKLHGARVKIVGPFGVATITSQPFIVYKSHAFGARDIVAQKSGAKILATTGASASDSLRNRLIEIDPVNGALLRSLGLGVSPNANKIELSQDGAIAFVGIDGRYAAQMIDLAQFLSAKEFQLVENNSFISENYGSELFTARDMITFAGAPNDVIISQQLGSGSAAATVLYRDGVAVMQETTEIRAQEFTSGKSNDEFVAWESRGSGAAFFWMKVGAGGYAKVKSGVAPFGIYSEQIERVGDTLYCVDGSVATFEDLAPLAPFRFLDGEQVEGKSFAIDAVANRAYFTRNNKLIVCDFIGRVAIGEYGFPGVALFKKVIRYGDSGLALLTNSGDIILLDEPSLVPSGDSTDLELSAETVASNVEVGRPFDYAIAVENKSTSVSRSSSLVLELDGSVQLRSVDAGDSAWYFEDGKVLRVELGDIAPAARREVVISLEPTALVATHLSILAISGSPDIDPSNNIAKDVVVPRKTLELGDWGHLPLTIDELYSDESNGRLFAFESEYRYPNYDYKAHVIDVSDCRELGVIHLKNPIAGLAVSSDGESIFIAERGTQKIDKYNSESLEFMENVFSGGADNQSSAFNHVRMLDAEGEDFLAFRQQSIARIKNGAYLPDVVSGSAYLEGSLQPDPSNSTFYYVEDQYPYRTLRRVGLSESGVVELDSSEIEIDSGETRFALADGAIWSSFRNRFEQDELTKLVDKMPIAPGGTALTSYMTVYGDILSDPAVRRVYGIDRRSIVSYDSVANRAIRRLDLAGIPGSISQGIRWGSDGFAFVLDDGSLVIARLNNVPDGPYPFDFSVVDGFGMRSAVGNSVVFNGNAFAANGVEYVKVNGATVETSSGFEQWSFSEMDLGGGFHQYVFQAKSKGASGEKITRYADVYVPTDLDTDSDGMIDSWERAHFPGKQLDSILPIGDSDGDGMGTALEFLFNCEPDQYDTPFDISFELDGAGNPWLALTFFRRVEPGFWPRIEVENLDTHETEPVFAQFEGECEITGYELAAVRIPLPGANRILNRVKVNSVWLPIR